MAVWARGARSEATSEAAEIVVKPRMNKKEVQRMGKEKRNLIANYMSACSYAISNLTCLDYGPFIIL